VSIAQQIFAKFRQAKAVAARPARERYLEFIQELAAGGEVELDELELVCSALDIDEKRLQEDINRQQRRNAAFQQIEIGKAAEAMLPKLEAEQRELQQKLAEFTTPIYARLEEVRQAIIFAQAEMNAQYSGRDKLLHNVLDPEIAEQEAELRRQRLALMPRFREIEAELVRPSDPNLAKVIYARQQKHHVDSLTIRPTNAHKQMLRDAQAVLDEHEHLALALERELSGIKQRLRMLDDAQRELDRRKIEG
jgi:hypothetical protein